MRRKPRPKTQLLGHTVERLLRLENLRPPLQQDEHCEDATGYVIGSKIGDRWYKAKPLVSERRLEQCGASGLDLGAQRCRDLRVGVIGHDRPRRDIGCKRVDVGASWRQHEDDARRAKILWTIRVDDAVLVLPSPLVARVEGDHPPKFRREVRHEARSDETLAAHDGDLYL